MKILKAEWVPSKEAYRLYDPEHPQQALAYEDDKDEAEALAVEHGYDRIVISE